jgi:DNA-binding Lrp family transcriptional regulator
MIKLFRKVKMELIAQNKFGGYLMYALGEILLVVIGILIAIQVDNNNEDNKTRATEIQYLKNVKKDLRLTISELDQFIVVRNSQIESAQNILQHYQGTPIMDVNSFNKDVINIYTWKRFFQINTTFQELTNSGNLALISNDSIKNGLLNMEALYKKIKYNEDHFRYDAEVTLYGPSYEMLDIDPMVKNYLYQVSGGEIGELAELSKSDFEKMLLDIKQKNGFAFAVLEFTGMNLQFKSMKSLSEELIKLIESEIIKG